MTSVTRHPPIAHSAYHDPVIELGPRHQAQRFRRKYADAQRDAIKEAYGKSLTREEFDAALAQLGFRMETRTWTKGEVTKDTLVILWKEGIQVSTGAQLGIRALPGLTEAERKVIADAFASATDRPTFEETLATASSNSSPSLAKPSQAKSRIQDDRRPSLVDRAGSWD